MIESFKGLEHVQFPEEVSVLVAWASFSLDDVILFLEANEDMFDSVHPSGNRIIKGVAFFDENIAAFKKVSILSQKPSFIRHLFLSLLYQVFLTATYHLTL